MERRPKIRAGRIRCVAGIISAMLAGTAAVCPGATFVWDGGGADDNWNTANNWNPNGAPPTGSSANDLQFAGSVRTTPNAQAAYSIKSLTFNSGASSFTIGGSALTIFSGGITQSSANAQTINNAITLGAAQTWNASAGNLTLGGNVNNGGFVLSVGGGFNTTVNGVISGSGGLTKSGTGTLNLGSANTYTGATTVSGGDLSTGTFTLSSSATLSIAAGATYTSNGTLNLNPSTSAAQTFISGAGTLRLRNTSSSASSPDIYYDPNGGTASGFEVVIASNVDLGTGSRFVNGKSNRNDYERYGGDLVFSGNLSGSASLTFTGTPNNGASGGPWQVAYALAGDNSAFSGGIILTDGANLTLNNANALTSANSVTFAPGSSAVAGLYLYGRNVTIGALSGTAAGTMNIRNGSLVSDSNATINPNIVRSNATLTVQQNIDTTFNGSISDGPNDHGAGDAGTYYTFGLTKAGTGTLILGGTNSYTGTTTINAGTLQFAKQVSLYNNTTSSWTASKIVVASGATAAFNVGGTGEFTSANIDTLKALGTATGGFTSGSILGLDTTNASGGNFTYGSVIANPNGGANVRGLTKLGTGTLTLTGANTFTGATTVSAGTLNIQNNAGLGTTAGGTTVSSGATLQLQNNITVGAEGLTISGTGASGQNGALVNVSGTNNFGGLIALGAASTISSDSGTLNLTHTGTITGATFGLTLKGSGNGTLSSIIGTTTGTLTKSGTGTWTLTGANTYTGTTTVSAGSLFINGSTASGSAVTVNNSGTTLGGSGTINGSINVASSGANLSPGASGAGSTAIFRTGAVTLASGSNFNVDLNNTTAGSGYDQLQITGALSLAGSNLVVTAGAGLAIGQKFFIALNDGSDAITGTFSQGTTISANNIVFLISYADNGDGGSLGNDISLTVTAVPEPATYVTGSLITAMLLFGARRRRP